jgi:hypothetical protein
MYCQVLSECAYVRGWEVHVFDAKNVEAQAARILGERAGDVLRGPRATLGPPWTKDHRNALAATIVASSKWAPDEADHVSGEHEVRNRWSK